jgi:heme/copper-type cytochrome/quinol oxidase subunit 3
MMVMVIMMIMIGYRIPAVKINKQVHSYHLLPPSLWPFVGAVSALTLTWGNVLYMHGYAFGGPTAALGLCLLLLTMLGWWMDIAREAVLQGFHTTRVQRGLRLGMVLFIVSEGMLFFSLFWAFFHSSLSPSIEIDQWPPAGYWVVIPWNLPLLNTGLLLTSGATATWSHYLLLCGNLGYTFSVLLITIVLGCVFMFVQIFEYIDSPFAISDGVFGSVYFLTTGFHGFHVFVGTVFLIVCLIRIFRQELTRDHHVGFECALWYWHFVDVVWLFLFLVVYWWGACLWEIWCFFRKYDGSLSLL